ncbi:hypothetical protein SAMN03080617_01508 [Algoriphagus alkaliphilus]|uniref:DNA repair protein n=1 Tax=Algoriphagus alkaliphilus TaxID=279824 RepID=A0A1G5X1J5_9BACT|nr:CRISPR-associated endonuclease Cas6 [Algoriphagus alkaliphilus]SDA64289.1 hypothetical protein SAMN03080617_01508 [Algoriphagus alkaliphilus]
MPSVRVIKITFDTDLKPYEIPAFRGAIIDIVGREHVIFHNHLDKDKFHYAYPLVQYKSKRRKAEIVCIQDGVDEIHNFFIKNLGGIKIGTQSRSLLVENIKINRFNVDVRDALFSYKLRDWLALNEKNFPEYQKLEGISDKVVFLEKILTGNLLSFAKGIQWTVDKNIEVKLLTLPAFKPVKHKGQSLLSFDIEFKTNVFLPPDIGLGKGASVGFGTVIKSN